MLRPLLVLLVGEGCWKKPCRGDAETYARTQRARQARRRQLLLERGFPQEVHGAPRPHDVDPSIDNIYENDTTF